MHENSSHQTRITFNFGWFGALLTILALATFFRFFHLTQSPPSLNWDEASLGYNAYSIFKTSRDEWGRSWPLIFKAFGEYKLPGMVYILIPSIAFFGLNDLAIRLVPALIGVLSVLAIYFLGKELIGKSAGLWAAFLLTISPWHIHLSRAAFEADLAFLFLEISLLYLIKFFKTSRLKYLALNFFYSILAIYTYNSLRILIPLLGLSYFFLFFSNFRKLNQIKLFFLMGLTLVLLLPNLNSLRDPAQMVRWQLVNFASQPGYIYQIELARQHFQPQWLAPWIYNRYTYYFYIFSKNYLNHFSPSFLFLHGGNHTQRSLPNHGLFYPLEAVFLLWGWLILIKSPILLKKVLFPLLIFAPVASAMTINSPSTLRSLNLLLPLILIEALALKEFGRRFSKALTWSLVSAFLVLTAHFFYREIVIYPRRYALDWQYGYRQAVKVIRQYPQDQVYFTTRRGEPYIFLLFYLPYSPRQYQLTPVKKVKDPTGWVHVESFGRYHFVDFRQPQFQPVHLLNQPNILIVALPDEIPSNLKPLKVIIAPSGQTSFIVLQSNHHD